jgi:hypothetical protein
MLVEAQKRLLQRKLFDGAEAAAIRALIGEPGSLTLLVALSLLDYLYEY